MNLALSVTPKELSEVLLNIATVRPVFIWGAPGIGKSSIVERFAENVGLPCVSASHAGMFVAFTKQTGSRRLLNEIIKGNAKWPSGPKDRDVLYFLAQSFRAKLIHELPKNKQNMNQEAQYLAHRAKALMKELSSINYEIAQMVVADDDNDMLPDWFMMEIVRDLPRLVKTAS